MRLLYGLTVAYIALGVSAINSLGGSENKVLGLVATPGTSQQNIKNFQQVDNHHHSTGVQTNTYSENTAADQPKGLIGAVVKRRLMRRGKKKSNTGPPKGSVLAAVTQVKALNLDMSQKQTADPAQNKGASGGSDELLGKKAVDLATPSANDPKKKSGPDPIVNVAPGDHAITKITAPPLNEGFVTTGDQQPPKEA